VSCDQSKSTRQASTSRLHTEVFPRVREGSYASFSRRQGCTGLNRTQLLRYALFTNLGRRSGRRFDPVEFPITILFSRRFRESRNGSSNPKNHRSRRRPSRSRRRHQDRRSRRQGRPLLHRPGQALTLRLRPGRHQRRQEPQGRGRRRLQALRRHHLRRRLPRQPDPRQKHDRAGPRHHRPARPHGRPLQPHPRRPTRLPPLRRHPLSPNRLRRSNHRPAGSSTRSTNRSAATRVEGKVTKYEGWGFLSAVLDKGACRSIAPWTSAPWRPEPSADAIIVCTWRQRSHLRQVHKFSSLHRISAILYQRGAYYANGEFIQVHPTAIPGEDKLRLMSESRPRRRRPRLGPQGQERQAPPNPSPRPTAGTSSKWYPKYGNPRPRDVATRAIFKVVYRHDMGIDGPALGLPRRLAPPPERQHKLEGIARDLRSSSATTPAKFP
jgi:hypothetical protein